KFKACEDIGPDYLEKSGKSCSLKDWDDWETPRWDSLRRIWTPGNVTTPWAQWCAFKAVQFGGTAISFAPSWVAWVGYLCDWLMFEARMAYDYYRDTGISSYQTKATQMARYAQRLIAQVGVTLIHEIGHSWANDGGSHCSTAVQCCFEVAAYRWLTAMEARFGLPYQLWTTFDGGDVYGFGDYLEHNPKLQRQYWQVEGCGTEAQKWGYVARFAQPTELYSDVDYCAMSKCYVTPPSCILDPI
ncbi:MAG: metallopeptidase family protein, partial [Proteobacteria bacterium]|nr:metallopeptidase family protein [Pseudomonadota bacterium]